VAAGATVLEMINANPEQQNVERPSSATAPNSKPSSAERSDPNNSRSPNKSEEARASQAQCV
jgi:hypothetical protein